MELRPYQQEAVDAATNWMRRSVMPGLLELATGAGKSLVVASIAKWVHENSGKSVLCLQPSKELTEQNYAKYLATGNPASIFSASAGSKCTRHPVVYGTPGTVLNSLSRFGDKFGCVIIDEAHGITDSIKMIVGGIQKRNPMLRIIGMTATPYRTTSGYIYQYDIDESFVPPEQAREPWFNTLLYRIQTQELIDAGYLTPAHADPDHAQGYDASGLQLNARGQFNAADVERVFEGKGRLTSEIVRDVVMHSAGRRGVMLFAATVQHAAEIMESLPPEISRMIGGKINMSKKEREQLINDFKAKKFKYLVSVGTLTTGFDAPHVDVVAVLRATESPGLFQQIIGRGLRLCEGKDDCLLLDYAENIERHGLERNLFKPVIRVKGAGGGAGIIEAVCPLCNFKNEFSARPNPDNFGIDKEGIFVDVLGSRVMTEHGPMPAHFGRRCNGQIPDITQRGVFVQCPQRWSSKKCLECDADNDIAARYCCACKAEIVDPNEKLQRDFVRIKKDPYSTSTDAILSFDCKPVMTRSGVDAVKCDIETEYRKFSVWFSPSFENAKAQASWEMLSKALYFGHVAPDVATLVRHLDKASMPKTVTYHRRKNSDFYNVTAFNKEEDRLI